MGSRSWRVAVAVTIAIVAVIIALIGVLSGRWALGWQAATSALAALAIAAFSLTRSGRARSTGRDTAVARRDGRPVFRGGDGPGSVERPLGADGGSADRERLLVAELPAHAGLNCDISLIVRITTAVPGGPVAAVAQLSGLTVRERETPVSVVVLAPTGLVSDAPLEQVIWVHPNEDPSPIRFPFHTRDVGLQRLRVTAWAGGSFLCELVAEVSVTSRAMPTASPRPRIGRLGEIDAVQGEVTLQISVEAGRYSFQLLSDAYLGRIVHAEALVGDPGRAAEEAIKTLRAMATGRSSYTTANARRLMREVGVGLWNEMVPGVVKEEFWRLRDAIGAFSIAAGDGIPWELLYPMAPGRDEGFLVEQFPVLRRAHGQGRSKMLRVTDPRFVVSSSSPSNAQSELEMVQRLVGSGSLIRELTELLIAVEAGTLGLAHFACHNTFVPGEGSVIEMDGGPFTPALLNTAVAQRTLADHCPLVFMNACRTAGAVPEYTQMVGWAQQFMGAGAGAFIGTLWAVRSESAAAFAEAFYERITAGRTLGEAVLEARRHVCSTGSDPTWLAYSAYGNPVATIAA